MAIRQRDARSSCREKTGQLDINEAEFETIKAMLEESVGAEA